MCSVLIYEKLKCASSFLSFTQRCCMAIFCFLNENIPASKNTKKKLTTIFNDFFEETKNFHNSYQLRIERSSLLQMFFKIGVLGVLLF